jgi:sporulation protein YlmC with PRC-barrel domain
VARTLKTLALAAIFATAAAAGAQPEAPLEASRPAGSHTIEPGQIRASKLIGSEVYNARDAKIGKVQELILDKDGKVSAVVVDVAFVGFGDKYVAVNMSDLAISNNRLTLDRTRDQLQQMASYKFENEHESTAAGPSSPNPGAH